MSHGGGGEGAATEPNLTPLLDLVLQLLMFFMICVNFVSEQVSPEVKLSVSDSALPLEKSDNQRLFINVKVLRSDGRATKAGQMFLDKLPPIKREEFANQDICVIIAGAKQSDYPMTYLRCKSWLKEQYQDFLTIAKAAGENDVKTVVHIRPDADLEYRQYFLMMDACKTAGFKKLKVHAVIGGKR